MRRINQLLVCAMAIVGCIGVGSCSGNSGNNNSVDIKMLSGSPIRETVSEKQNKVNGLLDVSSEDGESNEVRYVVMYKTEIDVEFKITVDNPQSLSIHSLQIICDDPNAKIQITTDNTTNWSLLTNEPAIAWNSSSLSQTTYKLQIPSEESLSTVNVSWLKYYDAGNTLQTNSSPTNNELPIYKMTNSDLEWEFVGNSLDAYKFKLNCSANVTLSDVKVGSEILSADESGIYTVGLNCKVTYKYDYVYEEGQAPLTWEDSREIVLAYVPEKYSEHPEGTHIVYSQPHALTIMFFEVEGTDLDSKNMFMQFGNGSLYKLIFYVCSTVDLVPYWALRFYDESVTLPALTKDAEGKATNLYLVFNNYRVCQLHYLVK